MQPAVKASALGVLEPILTGGRQEAEEAILHKFPADSYKEQGKQLILSNILISP